MCQLYVLMLCLYFVMSGCGHILWLYAIKDCWAFALQNSLVRYRRVVVLLFSSPERSLVTKRKLQIISNIWSFDRFFCCSTSEDPEFVLRFSAEDAKAVVSTSGLPASPENNFGVCGRRTS